MPTAELSFNPMAPHMSVDPYPDYHRLRETAPVYFAEDLGIWILTRYHDVADFLDESKRLQLQYVNAQVARMGPDVMKEPYFQGIQRMIVVMDGQDQRRIRSLFARAFSPKRILALRPNIQRSAGELIDAMLPRREADMVKDFCFEFPVRVIGDMLGVPREDHTEVGRLAYKLNAAFEWVPMTPETLAEVNAATIELEAYFRSLQEKRRREPGEDLFSSLVQLADEEKTISDEELISNAILIYVAGHETTAGSLGLGLLALHRNRDQLERLLAEPRLIGPAVGELLRYDASGQATMRVAMEDYSFGDVTVPAGSVVVGYIGAANRDPEAYPDPDRLDVTRESDVRLLNFGGGVHVCVGNTLARLELEVAFEELLKRVPGLELDTLDPPFRETAMMRGVASLPAHW